MSRCRLASAVCGRLRASASRSNRAGARLAFIFASELLHHANRSHVMKSLVRLNRSGPLIGRLLMPASASDQAAARGDRHFACGCGSWSWPQVAAIDPAQCAMLGRKTRLRVGSRAKGVRTTPQECARIEALAAGWGNENRNIRSPNRNRYRCRLNPRQRIAFAGNARWRANSALRLSVQGRPGDQVRKQQCRMVCGGGVQ